MDFEKYLYQQAELAKRKRLSKKKKTQHNAKDKDEPPTKKIKISDSGGNKGKRNESKPSKNVEAISLQGSNESSDSNQSYSAKIQEKNTNKNNVAPGTKSHKKIDIEKNCALSENIDDEEVSDTGSEYIPSDEYDSEEEHTKKSERKKKIKISDHSSRPRRGKMNNLLIFLSSLEL